MSDIRVTYSGLISLIIGLITIFTGFIFIIIITRNLPLSDFATWGLIMGLFVHTMILEPIVTYWVTREIARDQNSGLTAIFTSGTFSLGGIVVFLIIIYFLSLESNASFDLLFYGIILIPLMYLNKTLMKINWAWKPHVTTYATLGLSLSQILFGLIFIEFFNWNLIGLILTIFLATTISITINFIYARNKITKNIDSQYIKKWFKLFWLPLYPHLILMLYKSDIIIFIFLTHSITGLSFWTAAVLITTQISIVTLISRAAYAKLLQAKNTNLIDNFTLIFYFGIPFTTLIIVFSRPILFALNPLYEFAFLIVVFLSIRMFFYSLNDILESYLLGVERVDFHNDSRLNDFLKSKLFSIPSVRLIQYLSYLILFTVGLLILINDEVSELSLLTYWSFIVAITQIPTSVYLLIQTKKHVRVSIDTISIVKYCVISIVISGICFYLIDNHLEYDKNIFTFLPNLLFFAGIGIGMYLLITFLIDQKTRDLTHAVISEFKK